MVDVEEAQSREGMLETDSGGDEESHSNTRSMLALVLMLLPLELNVAFRFVGGCTCSSARDVERAAAKMTRDSPLFRHESAREFIVGIALYLDKNITRNTWHEPSE